MTLWSADVGRGLNQTRQHVERSRLSPETPTSSAEPVLVQLLSNLRHRFITREKLKHQFHSASFAGIFFEMHAVVRDTQTVWHLLDPLWLFRRLAFHLPLPMDRDKASNLVSTFRGSTLIKRSGKNLAYALDF
jgi:hypothetical protein